MREPDGSLVALDRRSGRVRFSLPTESVGRGEDRPPAQVDLVLAAGVIYTLSPAGRLAVLDLTSGAVQAEVLLPTFVDPPQGSLLCPIEGGVIAAQARGKTVHLAHVMSGE